MSVYFYHTTENLSPLVTRAYLDRERKVQLPLQYAMEHENRWTDGADSYVSATEIDDAMDGSWVETPTGEPGRRYVLAVDLGAVHDPTVIGVGHAEAELVCVDRLATLQGDREQPVQMATVERMIVDIAETFPPSRVIVESWQGLGTAQSLTRLGWPVAIATPTAKSNAEQWSTLAQLFASRRIVLPPHERLRAELLNLSAEMTPSGLRVTDRGSVHQDHAVIVRMLASALAETREPAHIW
jgi:hypothetical protein